ncbi:hypothetical protein EB796_003304 [Bugula neritina]|uniref:C2H2-type domain-containing protein n=1 Tax=Bugula neritina TaxID=10212 RepID=A0A7J7KK93_BUGNE|nr:hypothetical protein EB796_003304 [Bugula neritina]
MSFMDGDSTITAIEISSDTNATITQTYSVEPSTIYSVEAMSTADNADATTAVSLPLTSTGELPTLVTISPPKPASQDKSLEADEMEKLKIALETNSIPQLAQVIRSIKPLAIEIRKQSSQALSSTKPKQYKRKPALPPSSGAADGGEATNTENVPFVVKKRAPRTQTGERRRPWKPERLDNTKPILQCDACGYQANRRDYMRRHQIRVHSTWRPYQCTLCDFKTTEKHDLDRHMNSKYHGGKGLSQKKTKLTATVRIKCDQCNYSTKSVNSILKHKQIHALERQQELLYEEEANREAAAANAAAEEEVPASLPQTQETTVIDTNDAVAIMMENLVSEAQNG